MKFTDFPRSRDEWLEPPDSDNEAQQEAFENYINDHYDFVGKWGFNDVYIDEAEECLIYVDFCDFHEASQGYVNYKRPVPDYDLVELAYKLAVELNRKDAK